MASKKITKVSKKGKSRASHRSFMGKVSRFNPVALLISIIALSIIGYFVASTFAYRPPDGYLYCPKGAAIQDAGYGTAYGPLKKKVKANIKLCRVHGIVVSYAIAANLNKMINYASLQGLNLKAVGESSGYRTFEMQQKLRKDHGCPSFFDTPNKCNPATAVPGTSNHELGKAIDFDNSSNRSAKVYKWLAANARTFGFYNLPSESWHWSVDGH